MSNYFLNFNDHFYHKRHATGVGNTTLMKVQGLWTRTNWMGSGKRQHWPSVKPRPKPVTASTGKVITQESWRIEEDQGGHPPPMSKTIFELRQRLQSLSWKHPMIGDVAESFENASKQTLNWDDFLTHVEEIIWSFTLLKLFHTSSHQNWLVHVGLGLIYLCDV